MPEIKDIAPFPLATSVRGDFLASALFRSLRLCNPQFKGPTSVNGHLFASALYRSQPSGNPEEKGTPEHLNISTAGINRSNTAVRAVLEQPCSTGGRTGTVRPKHLPAGRTGLSDQFLGPVAQDQPGPVGQICPTSWLSLWSDSVRPTTGRTRLFEHRSSSRVRPVNAGIQPQPQDPDTSGDGNGVSGENPPGQPTPSPTAYLLRSHSALQKASIGLVLKNLANCLKNKNELAIQQTQQKTVVQKAVNMYQEHHLNEASQNKVYDALKVLQKESNAQVFKMIRAKGIQLGWLTRKIDDMKGH
ncbi:hypothetical protein PCASD_16138 [Puccinia coronata f. sp. avenae]|uniref:Uncharacterized protein n=1 Tax=Puccinia coronata f. sp. avenae TaxID=200324 RepID=A0A2N5TAM2_9BASI|nr:hypothetical protein PCASD_16138 [Puccinia coronata f. sp. avenae]